MLPMQIPATALQLAAKDRELRGLQEENTQLRQQVAEYEKAMQMASDYHAATQAAHQVGRGQTQQAGARRDRRPPPFSPVQYSAAQASGEAKQPIMPLVLLLLSLRDACA